MAKKNTVFTRGKISKYEKTFHIALSLITGIAAISCKTKGPSVPQKEVAQFTNAGNKHRTDSSAVPKRPFVDQWEQISSLSEFRKKLLTDLQSGDQKQILGAFSDEFEINPGTDHGQAGVIEYWGLDGTKEKLLPLKAILDSVLSDGGCVIPSDKNSTVRNYSVLWAPSHNCLSETEMETCGDQGCIVVTAHGSAVYTVPDFHSPLSFQAEAFEILSHVSDTLCTEDFAKCDWAKVVRFDGKEGFIPSLAVKSEKDGFIKVWQEPSGWKIMVLRFPGIVTEE